jgi:hypothetical protein
MVFVNTSVVMPPTPTNPTPKFSRTFSGEPITCITEKGGAKAMALAERLQKEGFEKGIQLLLPAFTSRGC